MKILLFLLFFLLEISISAEAVRSTGRYLFMGYSAIFLILLLYMVYLHIKLTKGERK